MASLFQRPVQFKSWAGDSILKWRSREVVGRISIEQPGVIRSEFTDAYVVRGDIKTVLVPAKREFKLDLKNLSLYSLRIGVHKQASLLSRVQIELRDDLDRVLHVFRKREELTAMPWSWELGSANPLVLPSKMSKRFLCVCPDSHDVQLDYQPLYFAKGATPFSLGRQPLLIRLSGPWAWVIEDGYRDRVVAVDDTWE